MTGRRARPRFAIVYSAGKIFLCARSPVTRTNTSASDGTALGHPLARFFSSWPPNSLRIAERMLVGEVGLAARLEAARTAPRSAPAPARPRRSRRGSSSAPRPSPTRGPRSPSRSGDSDIACAVRSSSHDATTLPAAPHLGDRRDVEVVLVVLAGRAAAWSRRRRRAAACRRRRAARMLRPSAYAAMIPYSMPLWTIFTKWPAPFGPAVQVAVLGGGRRPGGARACAARRRRRARSSRRSGRGARRCRPRRRSSGRSRARGRTRRRWCRRRRSGCPRSASVCARSMSSR